MNNNTIELNDGRTIFLQNLHQGSSYGNLVEGSPNSEINNWVLTSIKKKARDFFESHCAPHIIPPTGELLI